MSIQHATDDTFEQLVLKNDKPVVVDFWATWCGPCKMVAPEMEKIAAKYEGSVDVVKVDVDANPRISQAFNIMSRAPGRWRRSRRTSASPSTRPTPARPRRPRLPRPRPEAGSSQPGRRRRPEPGRRLRFRDLEDQ